MSKIVKIFPVDFSEELLQLIYPSLPNVYKRVIKINEDEGLSLFFIISLKRGNSLS